MYYVLKKSKWDKKWLNLFGKRPVILAYGHFGVYMAPIILATNLFSGYYFGVINSHINKFPFGICRVFVAGKVLTGHFSDGLYIY